MNRSPIRKAIQQSRCMAFLFLLFFLGCAAPHPSLKALNPKEVKVEVWSNGKMHIHGQEVLIDDLATYIENSTTEPRDPILICLYGDVDSYEMQMIRHRINDQMVRCKHFKYMYFSAPQASVSTLDAKTGTYTTYRQAGFVEASSGLEMHEDIYRFEAEQKAYQSGTYVSDALNISSKKESGIQESKTDVDISIHAQALEDNAIQSLKKRNTATQTSLPSQKTSTIKKPTPENEQESLRQIYERQQKRNRSKSRVR